MSLPPSIRWPGAWLCRGHPNPTPGLFSATSWSSPPTGSRARLVGDKYVLGYRCVCETVWLLVPFCHSFIHSSIHPSIYPPIPPSFHPSIHPSVQKVYVSRDQVQMLWQVKDKHNPCPHGAYSLYQWFSTLAWRAFKTYQDPGKLLQHTKTSASRKTGYRYFPLFFR